MTEVRLLPYNQNKTFQKHVLRCPLLSQSFGQRFSFFFATNLSYICGKRTHRRFFGNLSPVSQFRATNRATGMLRVTRRTLQQYRNDGIIPYIQMGGKVLYRESDVQALLERNYVSAL